MKKTIHLLYIILVCLGILALGSCNEEGMDESLPLNPALPPIKGVTALDVSDIIEGVISHNDRTIHLDLLKSKPDDLKAVRVHLDVAKRAELLSHTDTALTLDLTQPNYIEVNDLYEDITYTLTASIRENYLIDNSVFKGHRLNNDGPVAEGNINYLWDGEYMTAPDAYDQVGYRNYLTTECFTFDMGDHYYLYRFRASLYWAYTNVCPKRYQLWGYLGEGEPPVSGNWDDWTVLGTIDNSESTLADFGTGDILEFPKDEAQKVRYLRVRCLESYRVPPTTHISLCEITLWAWNL